MAAPAGVFAHTLNATYTSRLPLAVYLAGAAATVALSFIFVLVRDVRADRPDTSAPGHVPLTTHLFVAGSPHIDEDAVFGKRDSLVVDFDKHPPGKAVDGREMKKPYHSASYDFRLAPNPA